MFTWENILSFMIGALVITLFFFSFSLHHQSTAEFVCESHGLELIDYETEFSTFSKVECGNKKPELQYDDYKVFTK